MRPPTRISHTDRRARREVMIQAMFRDPRLTFEELGKAYGLSPATVAHYASIAGIRTAGRGAALTLNSRNKSRDDSWVERYRSGETLQEIADSETPPVSRERVRQIIYRHEKHTGERIERHPKGHGKGVKRVPYELWQCEICGVQRWLREKDLVGLSRKRCMHCRCIDVAKYEHEISLRRIHGNWHRASVVAGYSPTSAAMERHIYRYLMYAGRLDEVAELWPRGLPPWLRRIPVPITGRF